MRTVRANGIDLHVAEVPAEGPRRGTVVLLHGLAADSMASWFLTLAHPLAAAGFRVLLHDLRGHGRSARPATGYRLADFVADLEALLAHWAVDEPVHLVGNSFGGTIGFAYAAKHPSSVAALAAVESAAPSPEWFTRMATKLLRVPVAPRGHAFVAAAQALLDDTSIGVDLPASELPAPVSFAAVSCPVLCIYGGESAVQELRAETSRLLPQARHVIVPGQRHKLLIKAPDLVRAELLPFLKENSWTVPSSSATAVAARPSSRT
ncbi:alpha/beta fold hydrolase [Actinoplanes sp. RD1]|uniref:alpha/beta fold hydrolase n=1 Tax=Actinoplanes sp. RD1 TaxID=3064538 RepID=UPI00274036F1|nr:alpha/beta hydrolase [Actinoplanes sp. RD1]